MSPARMLALWLSAAVALCPATCLATDAPETPSEGETYRAVLASGGRRDTLVLQGKQLAEQHEWAKAARAFEAAIKLSPSVNAYFGLGEAREMLGDASGALDAFGSARRLIPEIDLRFGVPRRYYRNLRWQSAAPDLRKFIEFRPRDRSLSWEGAVFEPSLDRCYEQELTVADAIVRLCPNSADACVQRGCLRRGRDKASAISDFTEAVRRDPRCNRAFALRAKLWVEMTEYRRALDDLTMAINLDPGNRDLRHERAHVYKSLGQFDLALQDIDVWARQRLDYKSERDRLHRHVNALRKVEQACSAAGWGDAERVSELAERYASLFDYEDALAWLVAAIEMEPAATPREEYEQRIAHYTAQLSRKQRVKR